MDRRTTTPRDRKHKPYALYTAYPEGIGGGIAEDLLCPACGAEEIVIVEEVGDSKQMLGDTAQCWICKHEFTVTQTCWKARNKESWK